ncbi:unnamed protein product [Closterium sp. NIES-54]
MAAARRWPVAKRRGPALAAHCGPVLSFAARRWPVPARCRPSPARRRPSLAHSSRGLAFAACRGLCPAAALSRPLPCSRPIVSLPCYRPSRGPALQPPLSRPCLSRPLRPCPTTAPVAASALQPPCRGPPLLLPQSRPCPAAAPVAALHWCRPSRGPDLNRQLRPCPAPAPAEPRRTTKPRRPAEPRCPSACTATAATAAMASPTVLTFDAEGRAVEFHVWIDDLQLFLQCDSRDGVSLFDHTHLPSAECAHFGQYKTAKSLYDAVVVRYSSPDTAALSRLMLPYLFPDLAAFATVADLITHLRTSDARYRAALPTEFCAKNPPPMYITLYYLVTRLPDSLATVRDHFLSLCPTELAVDLVGAPRGAPHCG